MKKRDLIKLLDHIHNDRPIYCVNNHGDYTPVLKIEPLYSSGSSIPDCYVIRGFPSDPPISEDDMS